MKAICRSNANHKKFITVAHVTEDWIVDAEGNFLEVSSPGEVTHGADAGNTWVCAECGAEADVEA